MRISEAFGLPTNRRLFVRLPMPLTYFPVTNTAILHNTVSFESTAPIAAAVGTHQPAQRNVPRDPTADLHQFPTVPDSPAFYRAMDLDAPVFTLTDKEFVESRRESSRRHVQREKAVKVLAKQRESRRSDRLSMRDTDAPAYKQGHESANKIRMRRWRCPSCENMRREGILASEKAQRRQLEYSLRRMEEKSCREAMSIIILHM